MKRVAPLVLALALALLMGCGGGTGKAVAHVSTQPITRKQLDEVVAHFKAETQRAGRVFPDEKTVVFRQLRNHLLGLLVYREELRQAADRLGVKITEAEITQRLSSAGGETESSRGDTFAHDSVEAQLLYEGVFAKVTRDVKARSQAVLSARRNRRMSDFLARLQRETKVRYEPGFAPSP